MQKHYVGLFASLLLVRLVRSDNRQEGSDLSGYVGPALGLNDSSWGSNDLNPCSGWAHVSCDSSKTHVTRLNFASLGLKGSISPFIGNFTGLTSIKMDNNYIHGTLPPTMASLINLETLILSNNLLSGPLSSISNLSGIVSLSLSNNNFSGQIPASLTPDYDSCSSFLNNTNLCSDICNNIKACSQDGHSPIHPPPPVTHPPPSPQVKGSSSSSMATVIGGIVGAILAALLIIIFAIYLVVRWRRLQQLKRQENDPPDYLEMAVRDREYGQLKRFNLPEMLKATDNFSSSQELGSGGFGTVYKGTLPDGTFVAVKRLKVQRKLSNTADNSFLNELEVISKAVHRNVLRLLGFCIERGERLLVFPFMPNGSVADHLQGRLPGRRPLPWDVRMRIALGTAQGLAYMHYDCSPKLIHRDVKAANILLNKDFSPIIGDFGLAKLMDYDATHVTTKVRGTFGHIAPEYMASGQTSEKTDVFGFGIFLLELATGKGAYHLTIGPDGQDIILGNWVVKMLMNGSVLEIVDEDLKEGMQFDPTQMVQMLKVAIFCVKSDPFERPTMIECVTMLQGDFLKGHRLADKWSSWREAGNSVGSLAHIDGFSSQGSNTATDLENSMQAFVMSGPR